MPWIATMDARAKTWPKPAFWMYTGLKWYLVITGGLALLGVWGDRAGLWSIY